MVLTNTAKFPNGESSGWYLSEAAEPHRIFETAGFDITYASPAGGYCPVNDGSYETAVEQDKSYHDELETWRNTESLSNTEIDGSNFNAVFFVGGFGTVFDFPESSGVQRIVREVYESNGVVSAVGLGPSALINIKNENDGHFLKNKLVTAYSNVEIDNWRMVTGMQLKVPFSCEAELNRVGADVSVSGVEKESVAVDVVGRLVTGQNKESAKEVAVVVVRLVNNE